MLLYHILKSDYDIICYLGIFPMDSQNINWDLLKSKIPERSAPRVIFDTNQNRQGTRCDECGRTSPCKSCFKVFAAEQNVLVKRGLVDPLL